MLVGRSVTLEFIIAITIEITNHHPNQTAVMEMSYSFYHSSFTLIFSILLINLSVIVIDISFIMCTSYTAQRALDMANRAWETPHKNLI